MAQVAKAQGKTVAGLIAVMLAAQKKRLASAVASGFLTDDQAQQIESSMASRIKDLVNGIRPAVRRRPDDGGPATTAVSAAPAAATAPEPARSALP